MSFRVAEVKGVEVAGLKVRLGDKVMKSLWLRFREHLKLENFLEDFETKVFQTTTQNSSRIEITSQDITDVNLSFILRYEFLDAKNGRWEPSNVKEPERKTHVYPVKDILQGPEKIKEKIKNYFGLRLQ